MSVQAKVAGRQSRQPVDSTGISPDHREIAVSLSDLVATAMSKMTVPSVNSKFTVEKK